MTETQQQVSIIDSTQNLSSCSLRYSIGSRPWTLEFEHQKIGNAAFSGPDLFECLCDLRRWLEEQGYRILCNGARTDAWPSSMSRQMGGARKVYLTKIGHRAGRDDLVPIFGDARPEHVATVSEQSEYHRKWMESFR